MFDYVVDFVYVDCVGVCVVEDVKGMCMWEYVMK